MEQRTEIWNELQSVSAFVAAIPLNSTYLVPEGYFVSFPANMLEKAMTSTLLPHTASTPFHVPEGYFEAFPSGILARLAITEGEEDPAAELAGMAPLLSTVSKKEVYTVPKGYFAETDFTKIARSSAPEGKVITLRIARKWIQYAAAAVVTGILVTSAFLFTDDSSNYLENTGYERADVSSSLKKVSEEELVQFLSNPEHSPVVAANTLPASDEELADVKNNIRKISDEELSQYLKENGETYEVQLSEKAN